ncbi:hypothetical protein OUZ56_004461 [Daphnia magna]|uniref:Uncharacterized protein n=1 Tax=Daphnia magna TaxID=35525 RepID=A0ABQ9YQ06_9CRUS|nr:hypothetical protein OUZ56_004461 [Daphnia magna]
MDVAATPCGQASRYFRTTPLEVKVTFFLVTKTQDKKYLNADSEGKRGTKREDDFPKSAIISKKKKKYKNIEDEEGGNGGIEDNSFASTTKVSKNNKRKQQENRKKKKP